MLRFCGTVSLSAGLSAPPPTIRVTSSEDQTALISEGMTDLLVLSKILNSAAYVRFSQINDVTNCARYTCAQKLTT